MQPDREGSGVRRIAPEADPHLCVTFRGMPPSEELLHFARRCARRFADPTTGPLQLTVERDGRRYLVQLRVAGESAASEELDEDALLAIRNVFDRLSAEPPRGPARAAATPRRAWPPAGASSAATVVGPIRARRAR
ncbi:MAG: HPF/RaiA family ribosome-associated protein [Myxococcales bacterium]